MSLGKNKDSWVGSVRSSRGRGSWPFGILLVLLIFNSFRPDRLIAGSGALKYFQPVVLGILTLWWISAPKKVISNPQTKLFLWFLIVLVLGAFAARNSAWAADVVKGMFLYAFIPYLVTIQFVDNAERVDTYVRLFVLLSIPIVILGILNKGIVAIPVLEDENDFGLLTNIVAPMAYFCAAGARRLRERVIFFGVAAICVAGSITSFSRGAFVGLACVGLFVIAGSKYKTRGLVFFGLAMCVFLVFGTEEYWADMNTIVSQGAEEGTGKERLESWKAGWRMFLDYPIIGVGPGNFRAWIADYYIPYGIKEARNMWGRAAHSFYFQLIPETGLAGTAIVVLILLKNVGDHRYITGLERRKLIMIQRAKLGEGEADMFSRRINKLHAISMANSGAMIGFLSTGVFLSVLWYGYFWMLIGFFVMSANAGRAIERYLNVRIAAELSEAGALGELVVGVRNEKRVDKFAMPAD